ncbi:pilin [Rummeliibacillus pycnus]|uniref:pilin n=1 Tax=Rummeliibacillus pycnus TaxID=101070 RepID=UPI000C9D03C0|nr:pilin [Rummeliibacillus pycnus]
MFFKKNKVEVVPENEWTDYSEQEKYATKKGLAIAMCVPGAASVGLLAHRILSNNSSSIEQVANVIDSATLKSLTSSITQIPVTSDHITAIPTGAVSEHIASTSLDVLTTILDPVIQILVAISLPIASVIMIGSLFWFMFGKAEKAWSMIMNAGFGFVLIQLSPLFLKILHQLGNAVQVQ